MVLPENRREDVDGTGLLSFIPRPALEQPGRFARPLKWIINSCDESIIDLSPEYQRGVVWSDDRMSALVNSLLENYYVPPIIFNRQKRSDAAEFTLVCVDGKQRITAVSRFFKGLIPCSDLRGEKWWFRDEDGRKKNVFSEAERNVFLEKEFLCFEYTDLQSDQEEDLFARVQMGVPLTPAEKLRARSGPLPELAKMFIKDFASIYRLQKDMTRAKDFQLTLACISQIIEVRNIPANTADIPPLKTSISNLGKLIESTDVLDDDAKSHLPTVWRKFNDLIHLDPGTFITTNRQTNRSRTFAPMEMVGVAVLISLCPETRTDNQMLEDIRLLRKTLREKFSELRHTFKEWREIWTFIDGARSTWSNNPEAVLATPVSMDEEPGRNSFFVDNSRQEDIATKPEHEHNRQPAINSRKRMRTDSSTNSSSPQATSGLRTQSLNALPFSVPQGIPLPSISQRHNSEHTINYCTPPSHSANYSSPNHTTIGTGTGKDRQRIPHFASGHISARIGNGAQLPFTSDVRPNAPTILSAIHAPVAPMVPTMQASHPPIHSSTAAAVNSMTNTQWSTPFHRDPHPSVHPPHSDSNPHAPKPRTINASYTPPSHNSLSFQRSLPTGQSRPHPGQSHTRVPRSDGVIDLTGPRDKESESEGAEQERAGLLSMFQRRH